jgi:hypothetical protein
VCVCTLGRNRSRRTERHVRGRMHAYACKCKASISSQGVSYATYVCTCTLVMAWLPSLVTLTLFCSVEQRPGKQQVPSSPACMQRCPLQVALVRAAQHTQTQCHWRDACSTRAVHVLARATIGLGDIDLWIGCMVWKHAVVSGFVDA